MIEKFKMNLGRLAMSDCDINFNIKVQKVLQIFQELSIQHANRMGFGHENMKEIGRFWALTKMKYKVLKPVQAFDEVVAETIFFLPERFVATREFYIKDKLGNVLVEAVSKWVVVNMTERKLDKCETMMHLVPQNIRKTLPQLEGSFEKITLDETFKFGYRLPMGISHIDVNGHVNNTEYAQFVVNCLPHTNQNKQITAFEAAYIKEVKLGEVVEVLAKQEGNAYYTACKVDGHAVFTAKITLGDMK